METPLYPPSGPDARATWGNTVIGGNAQVHQGNVYSSGVNQKEQCWVDLRVLDPRDDMERIEGNKDKLLDEAYRWVFSTPEYSHFTTWDSDGALHLPRNRLLWIKGHAGTGKTMLMIGTIRSLSNLAPGSRFPDISFFFFQGTSKVLSSAVSALRSLIWLLAVKQPQLFSHVLEQYQYSGARLFTDHNAFSALSKIFQNMLRDPRLSPVYFALDAIDECAEGQVELIQLILTTFTLTHKVKWLISGRPEVDLSYEFQLLNSGRSNPSETLLELNSQRLGDPVSAYIQYKLEAFRNRRGYTASILAEISREVNLRSENTFLWVSLAFRDLERVYGGYAVERIRKMPSGLSELYDHMMTRIQAGSFMQPEDCMRVLEAAFLAFRPLSLPELSLLTDLPTNMAKEATEKCGSFLTITGDIVNLIHLSAKEYLERIYSIDLAGKHAAMGRRSLEAMSSRLIFNMYKLSMDSSPVSLSPPDPDPLTPLRYPCEFWADHLCFPSNEALQNNPNLADGGVVWGFLTEHLLQWLESLSLQSKVSKGAQILERLSQATEPIISPRLCRLLSDALKFLGIHGSIIEKAPLQVYGSALVFSPDSSEVRKMCWESRLPVIRKVVGLRDSWGACIRAFERLGSPVDSIAFSPCGKILAIILEDRSTQVLDIATGACLWSLGGVWCMRRVLTSFSPDGELLATISDDHIELREVATGAIRQSLYVRSGSTAHTPEVAFSPNGKLLVSILGDETFIWDLARGSIQHPRLLSTLGDVSQIAFSPDSKSLRAFCNTNFPETHTKIAFCDIETGSIIKSVLAFGHKAVRMALWPDGKTLASASSYGHIKLWDTMTYDYRDIRHEKGVIFSTVAFSPDGKTLACASNHSLLLRDTATGLSLGELPGFPDTTAIAFSPDGKILASAADETTWVWDVATGANRTQPPVRKIIFSSDGKMAASTSDDTNVQLWDVSTGELRQTLRGHRTDVVSCTFSPDGKMLASVSSDRVLYLWDAATGLPRRRPNGDDCFSSAWVEYDDRDDDDFSLNRIVGGPPHTFSLDSAKLACASDGLIDLWNITSEELRQIPVGDTKVIAAMAFSPDGRMIVSMTRKGHISLWDVATGTLLRTSFNGGAYFYFQVDFDPHWPLHLAVAFSPDGEMLATVSTQRNVRIWSVATASCRHILGDRFTEHDLGAPSDAVVFSPDSKLVASSSLYSSTIRVWDAIMGTLIQTTKVPGLSSRKLAFSQDGRYIETNQGSIRVMTREVPEIWELESRCPLLVTDQWITRNGKGIVWLSTHDKPSWVEVCGDVVVMAHGSGHMTWLYFNTSP